MKPLTAQPPIIRFKEIYEAIGMSKDTAYDHWRAGTFPIEVFKVGGILKGRRADLDRFLNGDTQSTNE